MSSIEIGSLADWVAAVGSVGAVGAALILANMERRRADRAEAMTKREREQRRDALMGEVNHQIDLAMKAAGNFVTRSAITPSMPLSSAGEIKAELQTIRVHLESIRALAQTELDIFVEIGRVMAICDMTDLDPTFSTSYVSMLLHRAVRQLELRKAELSTLDARAVIRGRLSATKET